MELLIKMIRDITKAKAQFLVIIIIAACGVFTFVGSITVGSRLEESVTQFYRNSNMVDLWINVQQTSHADIEALRKLPGVEEAQGRALQKVYSGNSTLDLFILDDNKLARPYLSDGEPFNADADGGIWLDREFAAANHLAVGDEISVHDGSGQLVAFTIRGLVLSPEKLIDVSSETLSTRHDLYGYAYMGQNAALQLFPLAGMNQILLKTEPDAETKQIAFNAEQLLGTNFSNILSHDEHTSTFGAASQIGQFKSLAYATPLLFFLIAVLVVVSTMSRLIANQRIQIGTLLSLGLSVSRIRRHYLSYGLLVGTAGGLLGLLGGYFMLPAIFMGTLKQSFILPWWSTVFPMESLVVVAAVMICCVLAVLLACGSKLKELPAAILKGKAPASPKKSRLESLFGGKWGHSFETLWMVRNLRAHKVRSAMGIIGSFGCAFLILFGFANIDTSNKIVEVEFERQYLFQSKASLQSGFELGTAGTDWGKGVQPIQEGRLLVKSGSADRSLPVTVIGDGQGINLNIHNTTVMALPSEGTLLSEKMAGVLDVEKGSPIAIRTSGGDWKETMVSETILIPAADRIFMSEASWLAMGETFAPTALLLDEEADLDAVKARYPVTQLINKADMKAASLELNEGVFASAAGLTVAAIFLGIAVIYSLGLINLTEMSREFATLKVLGFSQREVQKLIFRENLLLSAGGILLALPAGWWAIQLLDKANISEGMMLFPDIKPLSYAAAIAITILCSCFVNALMSGKLRRIDMVSSLKSAE